MQVAMSAEEPVDAGLRVHRPDDPERAEVQAFVGDVFARRYGARLEHFAPTLVSLRQEGRIVAAAGYRAASQGPLFLERYLPQPVELLLQPDTPPPRRRIVEVGHLAAGEAGQGRRLILRLGPHLAAQGFRWVVGTLTADLRRLFLRIGVAPLSLGPARPEAVGADAQHWGSYYRHDPVVLAGRLPQALRQLERFGRATGAGA